MKMIETINNIYSHLCDDVSKEVFEAMLEHRVYNDLYRFTNTIKNHYEDIRIEGWDEFIEGFSDDIPVVIFGAGVDGKCTLAILKKFRPNLNIVAFADNNSELWEQVIDDMPVYSLDTIHCMYPDAIFFITSANYVDKIYEQLIHFGIARSNLFYPKYRYIYGSYGYQYFDLPYLPKDMNEVFIDCGGILVNHQLPLQNGVLTNIKKSIYLNRTQCVYKDLKIDVKKNLI